MSAQDRAREEQRRSTVSVSGVKKPTKEEQIKAAQTKASSTTKEQAATTPTIVSVSGEKMELKEIEATKPSTISVSGMKISDFARRQQLKGLAAKGPQNKTTFDKIKDAARANAKTITMPGLKVEAAVGNILDVWAEQNDKLYAKGKFMNTQEKAALLKEVQKNPILGYELMTSTKPQKPPKTLDEALNRLRYVVSEITLGGAREISLPFSLKAGQPRRVEDAILQITGGLLTPSPADFAISQAFKVLAKLGKKGSRILRKVTQGTKLTPDEARQFEKLVGKYGYSTSDLRKAGTKLDDLTNAEWTELTKKYQKYYKFWEKNPDLYGAGAAYKPSALLEFEDLLDDLGYDAGEYINYLKKHKLGPTMNPATLIAFINGAKPPTLDPKAYEKIESDLEKYRESLLKKPKGTIVEDEEITIPTPIEEDEEITIPTPIEEDEEITIPTPIIEEEEEPPIPIPIIEEDEDITIPTPIVEDEEEPPPPSDEPPPPVKPMKKGDPGSRPNVFHALIGGIKEEYRVKFDYKKGPSETFTVTARSFPQALQQAQQKRRVKYVPSEVDIAKRGK